MTISTKIPDEAWASRPDIMFSEHADYDLEIRASAGAGGCELQRLYRGADLPYTDETPHATQMLFEMGFAAERVVAKMLEQEGFTPALGTGAQVIYSLETLAEATGQYTNGVRIRVTGTADGLYIAPPDNLLAIAEGKPVAVEIKTTRDELFHALAHPVDEDDWQGNLYSYSKQAALHALGCETECAEILVFNRNDTKQSVAVPLLPDAIGRHAQAALRNIQKTAQNFVRFVETGELPQDFDIERSRRRGYCNGCQYRSMCHPNGVAAPMEAQETAPEPTVQMDPDEYAVRLRRVAAMKAAEKRLKDTIARESADLRDAFVPELDNATISIMDADGQVIADATTEFYEDVEREVAEITASAVSEYAEDTGGYAHIAVAQTPGRVSVLKKNMPMVQANLPEAISVGKPSLRTTIARKAKLPKGRK